MALSLSFLFQKSDMNAKGLESIKVDDEAPVEEVSHDAPEDSPVYGLSLM